MSDQVRPVRTTHYRQAYIQGRGTIFPARANPLPAFVSHPSSRSTTHLLTRPATAAPPATATAASVPAAPQQRSPLRTLYPPSTPHSSGYLRVSDLHTIYYEVHGNPTGVPAVVVHGGPGAGCHRNHARFFDPQHYLIVLLDQRGCGRSTPTGCLIDNTTATLVADLDALRCHLGIHKWLMLGGSWGAALTLAYAQQYPATVLGIVLRGVCLMRPSEIHWMYGGGAAALKPLAWQQFVGMLQPDERANPVLGYYRRMLSSDAAVRQQAAKSWMAWDMAVAFSNNPDLLVWTGQQWTAQQSPPPSAAATAGQPQDLLPPPAPATAAAMQAAAAARGDDLVVFRRGPGVPAEVLAGCSCDSSSAAGSSNSSRDSRSAKRQYPQPDVTTKQLSGNCDASSGAGRIGACLDSSVTNPSSNAIGTGLDRSPSVGMPLGLCSGNQALGNSAAAVAGSANLLTQQQQQQHRTPWVWGLPGLEHNIQDPDVQALIQQGLNHRGYDNSAAQALLECHYSSHGAFLLEQPLLDHMQRIRHIPCIAVQGQMDFVCPPINAVDLSIALPEMELRLVPNAGHSMYDPSILHELVCATDRMKKVLPQHRQQRSVPVAATAGARRVHRLK